MRGETEQERCIDGKTETKSRATGKESKQYQKENQNGKCDHMMKLVTHFALIITNFLSFLLGGENFGLFFWGKIFTS